MLLCELCGERAEVLLDGSPSVLCLRCFDGAILALDHSLEEDRAKMGRGEYPWNAREP